MPLRHPGQYYDTEVGTFYNYFRDYDPATGRYLQSDPIGLQGGLNTYGYVGGSPLRFINSKGLVKWEGAYAGASFMQSFNGFERAGAGGLGISYTFRSECLNGRRAWVQGWAGGLGFGLGASLTGSLAILAATASFDDGRSFIQPDIFNGQFIYYSIYSPWKAYNSVMTLGQVTFDASGSQIAFDAGFGVVTGVSKSKYRWENCACEK